MPERVAIIGTREPDTMQNESAFNLADILTRKFQIIVRTGAAVGVDHSAMAGSDPVLLEVVLPWRRYNRKLIPDGATIIVASQVQNPDWYESIERLHPAPHRLVKQARDLHARNYGIIEPTILVVAMPDARGGGGTAQGIRVARSLGIPLIQANRGTIEDSAAFISRVAELLNRRRISA